MTKTVLVTGASGFVGANLTRHLLKEGHDVHLLLRPSSNIWRIREIVSLCTSHTCDPEQASSLQSILKSIQPDWIFHLAAHGAYSWQNNPQEILSTNIQFTLQLLEACLQNPFETFIHAGSSSEYGLVDHAPCEDELPHPNSTYAVGKLTATHLCDTYARTHRANIITLRLYSVYGPYEDPNRLIPTLITHGLKNTLPNLVDPKIARDFIHVADICQLFLKAAAMTHPPGEIYNAGTGIQSTLESLVDFFRNELNITEKPSWGSMDNRHWDTSCWVSNSKKAEQKLKWKAEHRLAEGLRKTLAWFRDNPDQLDYYHKAQSKMV